MKKIERININDNYRIVAISDIHGGYENFKRLLEKVEITKGDFLVILGDVIEKGDKSYETFEYCKELIKSDNVFYIKGNWEHAVEEVFSNGDLAQKILNYVKKVNYESILDTWTKKLGRKIEDFTDSIELYNFLSGKMEEDLRIIKNLPMALVIDEFIFVHSGIGQRKDWENSTIDEMLINDNFSRKKNLTDKYVVVGHWPTSNYRENSLNSEIFINEGEKIISIDGGYSVKQTGQLNALIIEKTNGTLIFTTESSNDFKKVTYLRKDPNNYLENKLIESQIVDVGWPDYNLLPIEKMDKVTRCIKEKTGEEFYIINELIKEKDGKFMSKIDYLSNFLEIKDNEIIEIVESYMDFSLVRYKKEFGWVANENILSL